MKTTRILGLIASLAIALNAAAKASEPEAKASESERLHAIAMHGKPRLEKGFKRLPYVDPNARQGGKITYGVIGTFDSLNPFILSSIRTTARGMWDPEYGKLVFEPLMTRSADEPFTLYGLLAESVEMPESREWITFHLRPEAKWSDGKPVTPEDVIFTYDLLEKHGRPPFGSRTERIERIEKIGTHSVRFAFNEKSDREFPLIVAGFTPVLPKHAIDPEKFAESSLEPMIGSGPFLVEAIEPGRKITYRKRRDYWGKNLPANRGTLNFERISVEYFLSAQSRFEAFKKGLLDIHVERDPTDWARAYDFPAVRDGRVKKISVESGKPASPFGFAFNSRRPAFADKRVRKALAMLFDFEWANRNLFFGAYERIGSFWQGSSLSALGVPATKKERELLGVFSEAVDEEVMNGSYAPPRSDGTGSDRKILREAFRLLREAGFKQGNGGLVHENGTPLAFEILTRSEREEKLALAYKSTLDRIGAKVSIRSVDDAQYQRRIRNFDYDVIATRYSASLSPGIEQGFRWGSQSRNLPGSFNFSGVAEPSIDAMIEAMLSARSREDFEAATRALDRLLISGHYATLLFDGDAKWFAHWERVAPPDTPPLYGNQYPTWRLVE